MTDFPILRTVGLSGILIQFADSFSEPANRAALAFRAAVENARLAEVTETSTSLVSTFVSVDLSAVKSDAMIEQLGAMLKTKDWFAAPLPKGRTLWRVPTLYGTDRAPQLEEAAQAAGVTAEQAIEELSTTRVRVLNIGFAPGQPYMSALPENWDIPRQQVLTKSVPQGALVTAIRQLIVFTNASPTGWRHVGQTAFHTFRPASDTPFALSPGDEMCFPSVTKAEFNEIEARDSSGNGGAEQEAI